MCTISALAALAGDADMPLYKLSMEADAQHKMDTMPLDLAAAQGRFGMPTDPRREDTGIL